MTGVSRRSTLTSPVSPRLVPHSPDLGSPLSDCSTALDLKGPRPVLLVVGGAKSLDQDVGRQLERLLERGAVRAAAATGAILVDGGTHSGVMAVLGKAVSDSDAEASLLGVAPANWLRSRTMSADWRRRRPRWTRTTHPSYSRTAMSGAARRRCCSISSTSSRTPSHAWPFWPAAVKARRGSPTRD